LNAPEKPKPDDEFRMSASEFDEAMRKAFGVPPPEPKRRPLPMKIKKERPKSQERK
jgi:hypothetical protein